MGNNMFAYCGNNPVIFRDTSGTRHEISAGGGGAFINPYPTVSLWKIVEHRVNDVVRGITEDIENYDKDNESEATVLASNYFSSYKGVPVLRTNGDRSGSFGILFITRETNDRPDAEDIVRHEYGHTKQLEHLGAVKYALCIGLPSWQQWGSGSYYSKPWEITADLLGEVQSRTHNANDIGAGWTYLNNSYYIGPLVWVFID